jgi:hypothetical protein
MILYKSSLYCFPRGCASSSLVAIIRHVAVRQFCGVICNTIVIFHHRYFPWTRTLLLHDVLLPQGGVEEIAVESQLEGE